MQKVLIFPFLVLHNVSFADSLFSMWSTNNLFLTLYWVIVSLFQCWVHWNPTSLLACVTDNKTTFCKWLIYGRKRFRQSLTVLKVCRYQSVIIYSIKCKANRKSSLDGGQVKILVIFTEWSGKVSQDWNYVVNKSIPEPECWGFLTAVLLELV